MSEDRDLLYLERILESIDLIEAHLSGFTYDHFSKDRKTYDAVLMQLMNIGELVNRLNSDFKEKHTNFPWYEIVGMRNQIAHGYFEIKAVEIWKAAKEDTPVLKADIKQILD